MNKRFIGVLIFAFVVASGASLLLYRLMVNRPQQSKAAVATTQIVLATHDLDVGTVIKEDDVKLSDWPGAAPAGATIRPQDVVGRGVVVALYAKEPVLETRLAPRGAGGGLPSMIPKGMRAVAVRVNEVAGVAGFVLPGMHVDVLISGNTPTGDNHLGTLTKTLLQNVEVLSAGQDFKKDAEGKPIQVQVVNLLVTPAQAEEVSLASQQTSIQLVLRNPLDHEIAKTPGTAVARLFDGGRLRLPAPPGDMATPAPARAPSAAHTAPAAYREPVVRRPVPFVMEIISGTNKKEAKFDGAGEAR